MLQSKIKQVNIIIVDMQKQLEDDKANNIPKYIIDATTIYLNLNL